MSLVHGMTPLNEFEHLKNELAYNIKSQSRFAISKDVYDKFINMELKLTEKILPKLDKKDYE